MLILLSLPVLAALPPQVVVPLSEVLPPDPTEDEEAPTLAAVTGLTVAVVPGDESRLTLTYTVQAFADGMAVAALGAGPLTVEDARLDGRPVAVPPTNGVARVLAAPLRRGTHTVVLTGVMATPRSELSLPLPDAPVEVIVDAPELAVTAQGGASLAPGRLVLPPSSSLSLAWKPAGPPAPRPDRLEATAAVGLTLSGDGVEGAGVVTFDAIHGAFETVRIAVPGADWAEAKGAAVADSRLSGGWLTVDLVAPQTGRFSVDVDLRGPAVSALSEAPLLLPEADSREGWVSLYQSEEGLLSRQVTDLALISPASVPDWGQGLASGQLTSSLHYTTGRPSLKWKAAEFEALQTPGTVIDSAQHEVSVVSHGRALLRSRFQVRNDRGAWLWMDLPDETVVLAVRVAGHVVEPVQSDTRLGIPLEKSVETLTGLVSFPVEVALLTPSPEFGRRGRVALSVPAVSAPVADAEWTLYLPQGTKARRTEGNVQPVGEGPVTEITIARAYSPLNFLQKDTMSVPVTETISSADEEMSQEYWNQAYDAYKDNRFDDAEELLEQSLIYNSDNSAASALQDNVMVLNGEVDFATADASQAERVKAMARARSKSDEQRQSELVESAEEQLLAGNVDEAIGLYQSAIEVSDQLARLESEEAYVQKAAAEDLRKKLREAEVVSSRNRRMQEAERKEAPVEVAPAELLEIEEQVAELREEVFQSKAELTLLRETVLEASGDEYGEDAVDDDSFDGDDGVVYRQRTEIDFESVDVEGELVQPSGALLMSETGLGMSGNGLGGGGVADGIEGGVVGGEIGGVLGGVVGDAPPPPPPPPAAPEPEPEVVEEVLTKEFLQRIPAGRSYQSAVQMAAGVTGSDPNAGAATENENTYMLDGANITEPVTGTFAPSQGRWRREREPPVTRSQPPSIAPKGVTASRWIMLVPESGPELKFSRQLVPAGEALEVEIPYKRARKGRQGG